MEMDITAMTPKTPIRTTTLLALAALAVIAVLRSDAYAQSNPRETATENYPDEIMCIINNYAASSLKAQKRSGDVQQFCCRILRSQDCKGKEAVVDSIPVKLISAFTLERKKESRTFSMEIWEMRTSFDADKLFEMISETPCLEKPPKRFFVHKNFLILLTVWSVDRRDIINEEVSEIIEMCFKCDTINIGSTLRYADDDDRVRCGQFYERKNGIKGR